MKLAIILAIALVGLVASVASKPDKLVCYYGSWVFYRPGDGKFDVDNIDPFLCTHIVYSFIGLEPSNSGEIKVLDPWVDLPTDGGKDGFRRFTALKKINPNLKTMVAIGGWNEGSVKYSQTFSIPSRRTVFVRSAMNFLKTYGFDGLDLDWQYPNQRGGVPEDVTNYSALLSELRTEFNKEGYILSAAVAAVESSIKLSYDVPKLGQNLDFINVMTYDYHGAWDPQIGLNSPLYMSKSEEGTAVEGFNTDASIQAWIKLGAPASKLVLGIASYGRSFTVADVNCIKPGCPSAGPGQQGQITQEGGFLGFNEICLREPGGSKLWDDEAQVPYLSWGSQWVGYDDERSAKLKVDYAKKYNLGGAMVWSIDTDDFHGFCGRGLNPLMSTLKKELDISEPESTPDPGTTSEPDTTTTTEAPNTTTETPTTTNGGPSTPSPTDICKYEGYNRDPYDCSVFYRCFITNGEYTYVRFECDAGLWFDLIANTCNFPNVVDCVPQIPPFITR